MKSDYRIVKHTFGKIVTFSIHEVFYEDDGKIISWQQNPASVLGDDLKDLKDDYRRVGSAFTKPVISAKAIRSM